MDMSNRCGREERKTASSESHYDELETANESSDEEELSSDRTQIISDPDDCTDPDLLFQIMDILAEKAEREDNRRALDALVNRLECRSCTGLYVDPVFVRCGHTFCKTCAWSMENSVCPVCGFNFSDQRQPAVANAIVVEALRRHVARMPADRRRVYERRRRVSVARIVELQNAPPPPRPALLNPWGPGFIFRRRRRRRRPRILPPLQRPQAQALP